MPHVSLAAKARADIARPHRFLVDKDPAAAQRAVVAMHKAFAPLAHAPLMGRPTDDDVNLRELVIDFGASGYLTLYCYEAALDAVTLLAVKHQREDDYK